MNDLPKLTVKIGDEFADVIVHIGFAKSKREARYLIKAGAVSLRKMSTRSHLEERTS